MTVITYQTELDVEPWDIVPWGDKFFDREQWAEFVPINEHAGNLAKFCVVSPYTGSVYAAMSVEHAKLLIDDLVADAHADYQAEMEMYDRNQQVNVNTLKSARKSVVDN